MRALHLGPVLLAVAGAGCGETLIDHSSPLAEPPILSVCDVSACPAPDPGLIGSTVRACVPGPDGQVCGYACEDGFIKCDQGCCRARAVAAGARHTCAITADPADGELYCWGANESRQAAPGVIAPLFSTPRKVRSAVEAVALGDAHTCAIAKTTGAVECWGLAAGGRLGPGARPIAEGATAIAAGNAHTCAVVAEGVQCWGSNSHGQRGGGLTDVAQALPDGSGATAVAAGARHTCAVVRGAVQCWGADDLGQLGDGGTAGSTEQPTPVPGIASATRVVAGEDYACAGASAGEQSLRCWGNAPGLYGAPGPASGPAVPLRRIRDGEPDPIVEANVTLLGAGRAHACVQAGANASVSCFGDNGLGQLGAPLEAGDASADIELTTGAISLAVGGDHGCAVFPDGTVWCWGANDRGQLGNGSTVRPRTGLLTPIAGR